jgi:DNA modification methylase
MREWQVLVGDVLEQLAMLPSKSIHCCVTSPPYWGLRDYGVSGQIGLEATPEDYTAKMVEVFEGVRRVLRPDGTLWVNLGDSHSSGGNGGHEQSGTFHGHLERNGDLAGQRKKPPPGLKPKNLVGIPWRVAFALQAAGWYLRQDIIWAKPNPMPESVTDRCTKAHEYLFLLAKSERYYYDAEAIKERANGNAHSRKAIAGWAEDGAKSAIEHNRPAGVNPKATRHGQHSRMQVDRDPRHLKFPKIKQNESFSEAISGDVVEWRNKRDVWEIASYPYAEAHFATFPPDLVKPCILAGCPEGGTVLDPFSGAGTTGLVAIRHHRKYIGIELNPEYAAMSVRRLANDAPLFNGACDNAIVSKA